MSSMLEQAIIDAEALKEAALKSAQQQIEEKYSLEIKEAMKVLLEQPEEEDPFAAGAPDELAAEDPEAGVELDVDAPLAAEEGEQLCACPDEDEPIMINIDFEELESAIESEIGGTEGEKLSLSPEEEELVSLQEEVELDEDLIDEYLGEDCPSEEEEEIEIVDPLPGEMDPLSPEEKLGLRRSSPRRSASRMSAKSRAPYSTGSSGLEEDKEKEKEEEEEPSGEAGSKRIARSRERYAAKSPRALEEEDKDKDKEKEEEGESYGKRAVKSQRDRYAAKSPRALEEIDLDEELKELEEMLDVQTSGQKTGWQVAADSVVAHEEDLERAKLQSTELEDEKAELEEANKELTKENKKFRSAIMQMKEKLEEVNLSNAKLLYTNRVISNDSLNERQRKRIVESIAKADSIDEAKVIFETLQSATGPSTFSRKPKSLSEAVSRPSSILSARRREEEVNPYAERMKILAGIKK